MKHYFLFGSEACSYYDQYGSDYLVSLLSKRSLRCEVFCFEVGVTSPVDLLEAVSGWYDYRSIMIDEYEKLNCND